MLGSTRTTLERNAIENADRCHWLGITAVQLRWRCCPRSFATKIRGSLKDAYTVNNRIEVRQFRKSWQSSTVKKITSMKVKFTTPCIRPVLPNLWVCRYVSFGRLLTSNRQPTHVPIRSFEHIGRRKNGRSCPRCRNRSRSGSRARQRSVGNDGADALDSVQQ